MARGIGLGALFGALYGAVLAQVIGAFFGGTYGFFGGVITGFLAWLVTLLSARRGEVFTWYLAGIAGGFVSLSMVGWGEGFSWMGQLPPLIGGAVCATVAHRWPIPSRRRVREVGSRE